jgi:KUP system potassium uptake protein
VAVTATMVIRTILAGVVSHQRLRWPVAAALAVTAGFLLVDLAFLGANLVRIPQGGWVPLVVAAAAFTIMTTWRRGDELVSYHLCGERMTVDAVLTRNAWSAVAAFCLPPSLELRGQIEI